MPDVTLAYPYDGHDPDDTIEVDEAEARQLIADGRARYGVKAPTTVADILAAVGSDPDAAASALNAETASDKPRASLVSKLEQIVDPLDSDD